MLGTLYRELTNHFYLAGQTAFVKQLIEDNFGRTEELNRVASGKRSVYNSWTSYLRAFKMAASKKSSSLWSDVTDGQKKTWTSGSSKYGSMKNDSADAKLESLMAYDKTGPLGSTDKRVPLDIDDTMSMLDDYYLCS